MKKQKPRIIIARFLSVVFALVFALSAFSFANTKATEAVFKVQNASIAELSNDATGEVISYDDGSIESGVRFYHRGDSAKYNIELKNTDSKSHKIISISDDNSNPYIEYAYDAHENHELAAGESFSFELLATYANAVEDLNDRDQRVSIKLIITYEEEQDEIDINPDESPDTGDKIGLNVALMTVSAIGLLVCVFISRSDAKSKKKPVLGLIIALSLALTAATNAVAVLSDEVLLSIDFGLYDKIVVSLDGQEATVDYDAVKDLIDAIEPTKTGYNFDGWQKQDGSDYSPADKITGDVEMTSKWSPIAYTLVFQKGSEGSPSGTMETVNAKYDEPVTLPECAFENTGWHFVGWEIEGETYEAGAEVKNLTTEDGKAITAVAKWEANTDTAYTVVHKKMKLDGQSYETAETENLTGTTGSEVTPAVKEYASFTAPSTQTVTIAADGTTSVEYLYTRNQYSFSVSDRTDLDDSSTPNGDYYYETEITVKAKNKEGYTFDSWKDDTGATKSEDGTYTFTLEEDTTLTPVYTINRYTITFDTDGGSEISPITQDYNSDITPPADPTKTGYNFAGWNPELPAKMPAESLSVKATWTEKTATLSYDANGHGTAPESVVLKYTQAQNTAEALMEQGYTFAEWNTESDGSGDSYAPNSVFKAANAEPTNATLYAIWRANDNTAYTVVHEKMKLDGESYETADTENLTGTTGSEVTPAVKDYTGFTAPSTQTVTIAADGSTRVEYKYTRNKYDFAVTNRENLETDSTANGSYYYETEITVKAKDIEGHTFAGWSDDEAGKEYTFVLEDNKTLTANYTVNKYTITFDTDGGSEISPITQDYNSDITPPAAPTKTGYNFAGWNPELPAKMPAEGLNVKATWTEKTATLSYDANGHGVAPESVELKYTQAQNAAAAIESGDEYSFEGWNTKADGTGDSYEPGNEIKAANVEPSDIVLYAQWSTMRSITLHYGDYAFDGQSYLNTNFKPFSLENFNVGAQEFTDFNISFNIDSMTPKSGQSNNRNVIVSSLDEETKVDNVKHYIGFDFRYLTNSKYYELESASNRTTSDRTRTTQMNDNFGNPDSYPWHVELKRSGTEFGVNGQMNMDYVQIKHNHDVPLTFGAQIQKLGNMQAWRYFIGEMSDIELTLYYKEGSTVTIPEASMSNRTFDGWNTEADGSGEVKTGTIELNGNIDLYAIWDSNKYTVTYDFGDLSFDGMSYLDTQIAPFSAELWRNDFSVKTTPSNLIYVADQSDNMNTLISSINEDASESGYPGFVYRYNSKNGGVYQYAINAASNNKKEGGLNDGETKIIRKNQMVRINSDPAVNFASFSAAFSSPAMTFGASIKNGVPFRYAHVDLKDTVATMQYVNNDEIALPIPVYHGGSCQFTGWTGDNGDTPQETVVIPEGNTSDKYYKANFECTIEKHAVVFNPNGGNVRETYRSVVDGEAIGDLPTPTREGYSFVGWFKESSLENQIDKNFVPDSNIELFAKWKVKQYAITFNSDNGSAAEVLTLDYGATIPVPSDPVRDGYNFISWSPSIPATMPARNIEVKAIWRNPENLYTITYDYGDLNFDGQSYLNTGVTLFSDNAIYDDFDLSLTVANSEHLAGQDSNLNTVFNALDESGNPHPGMVFRRDASKYNFTANASSTSKFTIDRYDKTSIHVARDRGTLRVEGYTNSIRSADFAKKTDTPLSFGASLKSNGEPWRYFKGDLSSVVVSKQYDNTEAFTLPTPNLVNNECVFTGWLEDGGEEPQPSVTIADGNRENKKFKAVFSCQSH